LASATQEQLDSQFWFDRTIEKFTTTLRIVPRARSCSAARGSKVEMQVYPGAYHGFDRANSPVREFPEYRTSVGQCADAEGGGEVVVGDTGIAIRPRLGKQI
jgi:dienelactone hydrolase